MKRPVFLALAAALLIAFSPVAASAQVVKVAVGQIVLEDPEAAAAVQAAVERQLTAQNLQVVSQADAGYLVNIYHKDTVRTRQFNGWFLAFFWLWPFVGVTSSTTTVYVEAQAVEAGRIVWQGSGQAQASTAFLSDFRHPGVAGLLPDAAERAVRGAGSLIGRQ